MAIEKIIQLEKCEHIFFLWYGDEIKTSSTQKHIPFLSNDKKFQWISTFNTIAIILICLEQVSVSYERKNLRRQEGNVKKRSPRKLCWFLTKNKRDLTMMPKQI